MHVVRVGSNVTASFWKSKRSDSSAHDLQTDGGQCLICVNTATGYLHRTAGEWRLDGSKSNKSSLSRSCVGSTTRINCSWFYFFQAHVFVLSLCVRVQRFSRILIAGPKQPTVGYISEYNQMKNSAWGTETSTKPWRAVERGMRLTGHVAFMGRWEMYDDIKTNLKETTD
jgi:hypothetical protein